MTDQGTREPLGQGSPMEPMVGGAKAELTGQQAEKEGSDQRLEAEP